MYHERRASDLQTPRFTDARGIPGVCKPAALRSELCAPLRPMKKSFSRRFAPGSFVSTQRALSRRQFLYGAGVVLSLPLLESMLPAFAQAAEPGTGADGAAKPRRVLAICNNLGLLPDQFFPKQAGRGYAPS